MLLNLEVNITAGSLTSCPGRCFLWTPVVASSCALSIAGGDVLSTRSTGIFVVVVVVVQLLPRWCRAATAALLAAQSSMAATAAAAALPCC